MSSSRRHTSRPAGTGGLFCREREVSGRRRARGGPVTHGAGDQHVQAARPSVHACVRRRHQQSPRHQHLCDFLKCALRTRPRRLLQLHSQRPGAGVAALPPVLPALLSRQKAAPPASARMRHRADVRARPAPAHICWPTACTLCRVWPGTLAPERKSTARVGRGRAGWRNSAQCGAAQVPGARLLRAVMHLHAAQHAAVFRDRLDWGWGWGGTIAACAYQAHTRVAWQSDCCSLFRSVGLHRLRLAASRPCVRPSWEQLLPSESPALPCPHLPSRCVHGAGGVFH